MVLDNNLLEYENYVESCLSQKFDHCTNKIVTNQQTIDKHIPEILKLLGKIEFGNQLLNISFILHSALSCQAPWNSSQNIKHAEELNRIFKKLHSFSLDYLPSENANSVFNLCLEKIIPKLSLDNSAQHPAYIEVYYKLVLNLKEHASTLEISPELLLPVSLNLLEHYLPELKFKGLQCCKIILESLNKEHFKKNNYHDVIYQSLKKSFYEKDVDTLRYAFKCFSALLPIIPENEKSQKIDSILCLLLEQTMMEGGLKRKKELINFIEEIIEIQKADCAKRKKLFTDVMCDTVEIFLCSHHKELLDGVLKCLQIWLRYCWFVTRLNSDKILLFRLCKLAYFVEGEQLEKTLDVLTTIINLQPKEAQDLIITSLESLKPTHPAYEKFKTISEAIINKKN